MNCTAIASYNNIVVYQLTLIFVYSLQCMYTAFNDRMIKKKDNYKQPLIHQIFQYFEYDL